MAQGRFTGKNYRRMPKPTMMPVRNITDMATGDDYVQPAPQMQQMRPSQIDPAYEAFIRGEDLRGTYTPGLLEPVDDSDVRAWQMDRGMMLTD